MRPIVLALFWLAARPAVAASCTAITAKGDCQTSAACEWHAASLSCIKKLTALRDDDDAADDGDDAGTTLLDDVADDALDDDATDGCGSLGCNWTNPKDGNSTTARVWLRCGAHNRTRGRAFSQPAPKRDASRCRDRRHSCWRFELHHRLFHLHLSLSPEPLEEHPRIIDRKKHPTRRRKR